MLLHVQVLALRVLAWYVLSFLTLPPCCSAEVARAYISPFPISGEFKVSQLKVKGEKSQSSMKHVLWYGGKPVSPWHDIPFTSDDIDAKHSVNFVCRVPRGTTERMSISRMEKHNPIIQETKKTKLLFYEKESLVNYGTIPQTWEDPDVEYKDTDGNGDDRPLDLVELGARPCAIGTVETVRVVGVLALSTGDGFTDWKVLGVRTEDSDMSSVTDASDLKKNLTKPIIKWLERVEGSSLITFTTHGKRVEVKGRQEAIDVCREAHTSWQKLSGHEQRKKALELKESLAELETSKKKMEAAMEEANKTHTKRPFSAAFVKKATREEFKEL